MPCRGHGWRGSRGHSTNASLTVARYSRYSDGAVTSWTDTRDSATGGVAAEDLHAAVQVAAGQLGGGSGQVHRTAVVGRHRRIEDHPAQPRTLGEVARVLCVELGHPEELGVVGGREAHRRRPGCALLVGGTQGHIQIGVHQGAGVRVQVEFGHDVTRLIGVSA